MRAGVAYGPYGGAGYAARYNPATGSYSRGAAAWGPGGVRGAAEAWNPRTGTSAQTRQGANIYGRWGSTAVQRGDQWARTAHVTNRATGTTTRVAQGSGGNVFAGHDGSVYRNQNGSWQKYESGGWNNVQRPTGTSGTLGADARQNSGDRLSPATRDQLNRDFSARREGSQRTSDLGSIRNGGGSYLPSGGGFRGGGFRGGGRR
jgi:hypothetical protein